ncbi:hypothetical protein COCCU_08155 [Corynebacterium occultum]|uniref:Copper chaperone PCu(A)C n=2 Tax=Corynebacterium occultum TaxID=2675219 RepID=A0A6B8W223_9CORY|nr:hypothetical protein COCCU_08155 [Corynebacterium occultum]
MTLKRTRLLCVSLLAIFALTLAACGDSSEEGTSTTAAEATTTGGDDQDNAAAVTLEDGVVRATVEDNPMTAIFGELRNNSDEEITITGFRADVAAEAYEIHETVDGVMQEKPGGITLAAGQGHELEPGAEHFMLMGLDAPVEAGDVVLLTMDLSDGSTVELGEVPVRTIAAGDEDYGDLEDHGHDSENHDDVDDGMENEH